MKTLVELKDGDCRFPFESPVGFVFCGNQKHIYQKNGMAFRSSYCHEHYMICVVPLKENVVPA